MHIPLWAWSAGFLTICWLMYYLRDRADRHAEARLVCDVEALGELGIVSSRERERLLCDELDGFHREQFWR